MTITKEQVLTALGHVEEPDLKKDLVTLNMIEDIAIDGNKVSKAKPDPEVFLKGAEAIGVQPNECVVFEDAIAGIEAAIAGGMKSVGIGSADVLAEADLVIPGLNDMSLDKLRAL